MSKSMIECGSKLYLGVAEQLQLALFIDIGTYDNEM